jgi:hypothetical protein
MHAARHREAQDFTVIRNDGCTAFGNAEASSTST